MPLMNSWNGTARSQGALSAELLYSVIDHARFLYFRFHRYRGRWRNGQRKWGTRFIKDFGVETKGFFAFRAEAGIDSVLAVFAT